MLGQQSCQIQNEYSLFVSVLMQYDVPRMMLISLFRFFNDDQIKWHTFFCSSDNTDDLVFFLPCLDGVTSVVVFCSGAVDDDSGELGSDIIS